MLGGVDPIIIFQFSKLAGSAVDLTSKIPVLSKVPTFIEQPPIPVYLSESLTGLMITTEDKSVDIETDVETKSDGSEPDTTQKGVGSSVDINLTAIKDSIGITLLSALVDLAFDKVTSNEYAITYFHGATTIFRGRLSGFVVNQNNNNTLLDVRITLTRGSPTPKDKPAQIEVPGSRGTIPLQRPA